MKKVTLVALQSGVKEGKPWFRGLFKLRHQNGISTREFWLPPEVGEPLVTRGAVDDVEVVVECDLDDFLRPAISKVTPVAKSTKVAE